MRSAIALAILLSVVFVFPVKAGVVDTSLTRPLDTLKIAYFGSSVPFGQGASKRVGYTALFTKLLVQRSADGTGKAWKTVNISVPGDNTVKVLSRWSKDLPKQKAKYVMYALSLGNEGIHEFGQPKFDQFKANITKLIIMARDSGYVPVVSNCYARNDYTAVDYDYIKQMNMWIHTLNVPTINLLGAVDDGAGRWVTGYWSDSLHPNDAGHAEMTYTIVPSLFDALSNGKPQPVFTDGSGITWSKTNKTLLDFKPDNTVHAFTTTVTIKADSKGQILALKDSAGRTGSIAINGKGFIEYTSPTKQTLTGDMKITDGKWHKITLTHYYARGHTDLYCDSTLQASGPEKLVITELYLGDKTGKNLAAKNWLFYRAGMNFTEVKAIAADKLLKSSLELYAPLNEKHLANLAQSTDMVKWGSR